MLPEQGLKKNESCLLSGGGHCTRNDSPSLFGKILAEDEWHHQKKKKKSSICPLAAEFAQQFLSLCDHYFFPNSVLASCWGPNVK